MTERELFLDGIRNDLHRKKNCIFCISAILLFLAGIWGAKQSGSHIDLRMRKELARQVKMLAAAIPPEEASELSFTEADQNRPEFLRITRQLHDFSEMTGAEFIGSFALKDGQVVFGPESLPQTDPRATPAGTVFQQPTRTDVNSLLTATPSIQGPVQDEFGIFVRASAPVIHPRTGKALMNIVLCQSADIWNKRMRTAQWLPIIITQIPLLVLIAGWVVMKNRHRLTSRRLRHTEAITCAAAFLLLTIGITWLVYHGENSNRDETFRSHALQSASAILHTFRTLENNLTLMSRMLESSEQITAREFSILCSPILNETITQKIEWIPHIKTAQRDAFEKKVQAENGWSNYRIWEQGTQHTDVKTEARPICYPVLFVEPASEQRQFRGFDAASDPILYAALSEAAQSGYAVASKPIRTGSNTTLSIYHAVSSEKHQGTVAFSIFPEQIVKLPALLANVDQYDQKVSLHELKEGAASTLLACTDENCSERCPEQSEYDTFTMPAFAFGKTYAVHIMPTKRWLAANPYRDTQMAFGGGLLLTLLLTSLIGILANRPALLEKKVQQRTAELRRAEEYAQAVLNSSSDAVIIHHPETGAILDFNKTAEQMFGISRNEIGTVNIDALKAEDCDSTNDQDMQIIRRAAQGHSSLFERIVRRRNGRTFPVEISISGTKIGGKTRVIANVRDIEQRKKTAEELKASEARFQIAADAANIGVWERDLVTKRLIWDKRMFELYGTDSVVEDASELWKKSIHPDDFESVQAISDRAEKGETELSCEFRIILPNQKVRYLRGIGKMLRDEKNNPSRMIGINYDITEQREAKQALIKSEARFRSLFEMAAVGMSEVSPDGHWIGVNKKLCEITGYSKEEMLNLSFQQITHPDDLDEDLRLIQKLLNEELSTYSMQKRYIRKDNSVIWIDLTVSLIRNPDGTPDRLISIASDISDRKNSELELKKSREFLQSTLDGMTAHIALLDESGKILLVNKAWRKFAAQNGLNESAACEGANYLTACDNGSEQIQTFSQGLQDVLAGRSTSFELEYPCQTADKNYWFSVHVSSVSQTSYELRRAVVFHTDITERQNAKEALHQRLDELRRFNKAATGRELRMIELKREINSLCGELGRENAYPLHSL
ncbi:PAS domain S-box protein [Tichowtungia aerotolerans]|uniref:histidine kinase n=1 Tax=Tichowtungia aerotolerans TaxID=2697043 RepID=A0A6P1MAM5_9BACT|nr:PAS domain S-box protein [Tichowtungia aerotolerans]QHI69604.1 PAS domain S-box protein [Tichowtungia aerotolerans]